MSAFVLVWSIDPGLFGPSFEQTLAIVRWASIGISLFLAGLVVLSGRYRPDAGTLFLGLLLLTIPATSSVYESIITFARLLAAYGLALAVSDMAGSTKGSLISVLVGTVAVIVIGSVISSFSSIPWVVINEEVNDRDRLAGLTSHPGVLGYLSALLTAWSVARLSRGTKPLQRVWWLTLASAAVAALLLADSRSGILAAAAASLVTMMAARARAGDWQRSAIARVTSISLIAASLLLFLVPVSIGAGLFFSNASHGYYDLSTLIRLALWREGVDAFVHNPLTGIGLGTPTTAGFLGYAEEDLLYFHSAFLNYLAKTGLLGGFGFLVLLIRAEVVVAKAQFRRDLTGAMFDNVRLFAASTLTVTVAFAVTEGALQGMFQSTLLFFCSTALVRAPMRWRRGRPL